MEEQFVRSPCLKLSNILSALNCEYEFEQTNIKNKNIDVTDFIVLDFIIVSQTVLWNKLILQIYKNQPIFVFLLFNFFSKNIKENSN